MPKLLVVQQGLQGQGPAPRPHVDAGARRRHIAGPLGSLEQVLVGEVAVGPEEWPQPGLVVGGQLLVQSAPVDGLGQQLGDVAARVVDGPTHLDGGRVLGREEGAAAGIDFHLQGHAQSAAIAQHPLMVAWQPRGTGVEILTVGKGGDLVVLAGHLDPRPAADGPVAPAHPVASLQDGDVKARAFQLVGQHETGDPGAQDDDPGALSSRCRQGGRRDRGLGRLQPQRLHGGVGRAISSRQANPVEELPPTDAHRPFLRSPA